MHKATKTNVVRVPIACMLSSLALSGCAAPNKQVGNSSGALQTAAKADIARLSDALEMYHIDMFEYPDSKPGLLALANLPHAIRPGATYREGGYIDRVPRDPWGRRYIYDQPGAASGRAYDLYSLGADGAEGGTGENADVGNWD